MSRDSDYDSFVRVYDLHWGSWVTGIYPILDHLVLRHLPRHARILDLCCGTGQLAAELTRGGYAVTGVDISASMIEIARTNAPDAAFHVGDARDPLPARGFTAVFSTFDSLNHLVTLEELTRVFANVREVLAHDSYFAFDLNMAEGYETRWRGSFANVEDDHAFVVRSSHDSAERTGRMEVTIFEAADAAWTRSDVSLTQRWYEKDEVNEGLRSAGFREIRSFDAGEPIAEGCPTSAGRMFFVARSA